MRLSDLIALGQRSIIVGIVILLIFLPIFLFLYKKYWKTKFPLTLAKCLWLGVTVCYLVVVFSVTLMSRGEFWSNQKIMPLFYSYKDAWVDFSIISWRNIILNICMFIPLGFLLPIGIRFFRSFWKVSLVGFLFTVLIEVSQLILKRGMFELDDLLDNTVGTMIGYGLYVLLMYMLHRFQKKWKFDKPLYQVLLLQLPLLITCSVFAFIFLSYQNQELGNVSEQYIIPYDSNKLQVSTKETYSTQSEVLPVYVVPSLTKEETAYFAESLFGMLGTSLDETRNDFYENVAVLYAKEHYILWMDYIGETYELTDFTTLFPEQELSPVLNASQETVRDALAKYSVEIPEEADFEELGNGKYQFTVQQLVQGDLMIDGFVSCEYFENGCFSRIDYSLLSCEIYKNFSTLSEQEAYDMICEGKFRENGSNELVIEVGECQIVYVTDSKGFYQPVYSFSCLINGEESLIQIPALT